MNKVIDNYGNELNAQFNIDVIDNELGLILESRGGSKRNSDYSAALEILLERLQEASIRKIRLKVVSRELLKKMKNASDRTIKIGDKSDLVLEDKDINELRKQIGTAISKLKVNKATAGGNSTKRIQLVSGSINKNEWKQIALGKRIREKNFTLQNTFSFQEFENEVNQLLQKQINEIPEGNLIPKRMQNTSLEVFERDSKVKAWVLKNASGKCECCRTDSPFITFNGTPYLEVHHLKTLANGGSDRISNTIALCPNCHREFHYGINREKILNRMYGEIKRLIRE